MNKDFISLLALSESTPFQEKLFSKENGFACLQCRSIDEAKDILADKKMDLLAVDGQSISFPRLQPVLDYLKSDHPTQMPVVFFCFSDNPPLEIRQVLFENGCDDILLLPLTISEIKHKIKIHLEKVFLQMEAQVSRREQQKSVQYLDRFKKELKSVKKQLYEERVSLNSALKQVNSLSRERSRLKLDKKNLKTDLTENIEGFFAILTELIRTHVEKNRGHGERVAHIADFVGREFKLDEKKLEDLSKAAMLHEVGLLFFPADVLNKPLELRESYEKDLFRQFPVKGAQLLEKCSRFESSAKIICALHENSDGTGYPEGLKRRYIPLASRILAGADLFDSIKDQEAINDLESFLVCLETYSGTRLDPNVVSVLEKYAVLHMGSDAYRVRGVGIHQLEPGMTLGTAVFSNTGTKLFSVNTLLTQDAIDKIKKYNREYPVDETIYIKA